MLRPGLNSDVPVPADQAGRSCPESRRYSSLYRILSAEELVPDIYLFRVDAPTIARKAQAGQFVIVRVDEPGERIPLTIADWDRGEGSISVVFHAVGRTTRKLAALKTGDSILNFVGPLGLAAHVEKWGTVVCVSAGYATATLVPITSAAKQAGNRVISIVRAPSKDTLFGEQRLASVSDQVIVVTGDGSYGVEGFLFEPLQDLLAKEKVDRVFVMGPACVMRLTAAVTRPFGVKTIAALNPIMLDGTGMCGVCRVTVNGDTKFACVDGPEFDAHAVDWDSLMARRCTYSAEPGALPKYQCRTCAQW